MEKLTLEHLAPYLPYSITVEIVDLPLGYHTRKFELDCGHDFHFYLKENRVRPHLRPMSDLTKPITVDGYNDGKPFVPIEELFQLAYVSVFDNRFDGSFIRTDEFNEHLALQAKEMVMGREWVYGFTVELPNHFLLTANGDRLTISNFEMYGMLPKWHFDVYGLIDKNLAVDLNTLKQ